VDNQKLEDEVLSRDSGLSVRSRNTIEQLLYDRHSIDTIASWGEEDFRQLKNCGIVSAREITKWFTERGFPKSSDLLPGASIISIDCWC